MHAKLRNRSSVPAVTVINADILLKKKAII